MLLLLGAARKNPRGASLHSSLLGTRISKTLRAARGGGGHGCITSILVACSGVRQYSIDDIVCERGSRGDISLMILMCRAMICGMSCRNLWRSLVGAGSWTSNEVRVALFILATPSKGNLGMWNSLSSGSISQFSPDTNQMFCVLRNCSRHHSRARDAHSLVDLTLY